MGAASSCHDSKSSEITKWGWTGPPGDHSPYPIDLVPYPGPDLLYCFIDIATSFSVLPNYINLGHRVVHSNVEDFSTEFEDCYKEGFLLQAFLRIPGARTTMGGFNWAHPYPHQAIFAKPAKEGARLPYKRWGLQVQKRVLSLKSVSVTGDSDENDLIHSIESITSSGSRLRCVNAAGYVPSATTNVQFQVLGVDLLFEVPEHSDAVRYTYHAVKYPVRFMLLPDPIMTTHQVACDADWMAQLKEFLDQGWKLVDICIDSTALAEAFCMTTQSKTFVAVWFFEKRTAELADCSPRYEGVIIEYKHKVKKTEESQDLEVPCRDWRPVIAGMGAAGWELATMVQTPTLAQSTFTTYSMKLLFFFQRRIYPTHMVRNLAVRDEKRHREEINQTFHGGLERFLHKRKPVPFGTAGNQMIPRHIDAKPQERFFNRPQPPIPVDNRLPPEEVQQGAREAPGGAVALAAATGGAQGLPNGDIPGRELQKVLRQMEGLDPLDMYLGWDQILGRDLGPDYENVGRLPEENR